MIVSNVLNYLSMEEAMMMMMKVLQLEFLIAHFDQNNFSFKYAVIISPRRPTKEVIVEVELFLTLCFLFSLLQGSCGGRVRPGSCLAV